MPSRSLRYLWAAPATLIGLLLACPFLRRGRIAVVGGVVEVHGPLLGRALSRLTPLAGGGADAITLGHVVIGRTSRSLEATRAHERVHVRQYESWGPLFIPAYLAAGLLALLRGGHPYFDNRFEREAREISMDELEDDSQSEVRDDVDFEVEDTIEDHDNTVDVDPSDDPDADRDL